MPDEPANRWRSSSEVWSKLRPESKRMRVAPTSAEQALWQQLRGRKLNGLRFWRQHAIDRFIVDFYCAELGMVVEVDGVIHDSQTDADADRDARLTALGLHVIRVTNTEVVQGMTSVLERIAATASTVSASGEGRPANAGRGEVAL